MVAYVVESVDAVILAPGSPVEGADLMSPFVWREDGRLRMMLRVVPKGGAPSGVIWAADGSDDGLTFTVRGQPSISPGPGADDVRGCEDPTVVRHDGGYVVFYTGVRENGQGGLLVAVGPDLLQLKKSEVLLQAPAGEGNIKEATLAKIADDDWVLFYEYAADDASRIGRARGPTPQGPWRVGEDPLPIRDDAWDRWHLSTGPIEILPGCEPVMFYNGATRDARWRIGWATFSPDYHQVLERGLEPMLVPTPPQDRDSTDIAFAASSVVVGDRIHLYYSIEDDTLRRAVVRRYA